ncbi:MAG: folylpolyglutamate synthase/dihydrofolate synthase family protein [Dehalococcoidales bacterium]
MQNLDYRQSLEYIYSFSDYETTHKLHDSTSYDLRRVFELAALFDNPHLKIKTIHIAGTKGKGSVAAMVSSVLSSSGYKTGLYTSPHLIDIRERFRIDGEMISETEFADIISMLKPAVETVNAQKVYGTLTTFEIMTAVCFIFFARRKVDFGVVEVGLGGRLDATNIIRPEVCIITPINLDHTDVLGDTIPKIALEKAGIIKEGAVVVTAPQTDEAMRVIEQKCFEKNCRLIKAGADILAQNVDLSDKGSHISIKGRLGDYEVSLPLLGFCQAENALTAVGALEALKEKGFNIPLTAIQEGFSSVKWPGRFQVVPGNPLIIIDGAHNVLSARELKKSLLHYGKDYFSADKTNEKSSGILVFGASADKDVDGIIAELLPLFNEVIVTRSSHPRSMETAELAKKFNKPGIRVISTENVAEAIELAKKQALNDSLLCITGSLFVAGDALLHLKVC